MTANQQVNQIIQGDCVEIMKQLPKNFVDIIVTSPPYEDISGAGYTGASKDILFLKLYSQFMDSFFSEVNRVLKPTGQVFFNIKSKTLNKTLKTPHWIEFLESFKQLKLKSFIIWKYAGSFDSTNVRFHLDYEIIYHLSKGDDIYLNEKCGIEDPLSSVWYIPHNIENRLHPTQMPEAVVDRILRVATRESDLVLDPFAGSGTTCAVAKKLNRLYLGIELNPSNAAIANQRINKISESLKIFMPKLEVQTFS